MKKYDGVLQRVREIEFKRGIKYLDRDSYQYKVIKVLCFITTAWALIINLFYILGNLLVYSGTEASGTMLNRVITVSVCSVTIIVSLILNAFKIYIADALLNVVSSLFLIFHFAGNLHDDFGFLSLKTSFYFRHLIPLAIMSILMIIMTVITVRAEIKTNRMYVKVTENLYNMYNFKDSEADRMTDEQWDEFLKRYSPYNKSQIVVDTDETAEETQDEG